jgi:hypothetical protein
MPDMVTLARLHAALDSVVETEQLIAAIKDGSPGSPTLVRLTKLVDEARDLLRTLLRHPVGNPITSRA